MWWQINLEDGTYVGEVSEGNPANYTKVTLEVKNKKIVNVMAEYRDKKNIIKDENYCKDKPEHLYKVAQKAVAGMKQYPKLLLKVQDIEKVDAVSGATGSYKDFKAATLKALKSQKQ